MGGITDLGSLRRAMAENAGQPEGPARNARAERLLLEAERLNVPLAVIEALGHRLTVDNYRLREGEDVRPLRAAAAPVGRAARGLRRVRDALAALGVQVDAGRHARPAARPARLGREVAR